MKEPHPDKVARLVLTDLAGLYAEVARTRMLLEIVARHLKILNINSKLEIQRELAQDTARKLSAKALKHAGLQPVKRARTGRFAQT